MKFNPGDIVKTKFGNGTIISKEGDTGIFSRRYAVRLDNVPELFENIHEKYGHIYIMDYELEKQ